MSVISNELRRLAPHLRGFEDGETGEQTHDDQLVLAAAAEIDRLRAIIRVNCLRWGGSHEDADCLIADEIKVEHFEPQRRPA